MRKQLLFILFSVAICFVPVAAVQGSGKVRVSHLSPDAPNVDVWVNGEIVLSDVPFLTTSEYLDLENGDYRIQVTPAGASEPVVIDATLTIDGPTAFTVAATGLLGDGDLQPLPLVDDTESIRDAAKVRFIHTSPDAPAVDVAVTGGDVLFGDVAFREATDTITVPPGTYDLEVRLAGTDTVALPLPGVELAPGTNYNVFAVGLVADGSLGANIATSAEPVVRPAQVRVAHLSPDAPEVDVRVNGNLVLESVPFTTVSGYLELPGGEYQFEVTPAGATEPVVIDAVVTVEDNQSYTIAATGSLAAEDLQPVVLVDDREADPAQARVRFVHTSPDAPAVDVAVAGGPVLFENVSFRESTDVVSVDPGTYDLEVRLAGTDTVALEVPGVTLVAGVNITVFAVGFASDGTLAALPVEDVNETFVRGDANRDGRLDIADPVATLLVLFQGSSAEFCPDAGDANDDSHLNVSDATYALNYLFSGGPPPAPPFPEPGVDPTNDDLRCEQPF